MLWPKKGAFENANDLKEQAFYCFIAKTYWGHIALQFAVLYALGGWPWFVWLGCVRVSLKVLMPFHGKSTHCVALQLVLLSFSGWHAVHVEGVKQVGTVIILFCCLLQVPRRACSARFA